VTGIPSELETVTTSSLYEPLSFVTAARARFGMQSKKATAQARRVLVERGIYRQPNGKYAVCFMLAGKPRFRTVACDLDTARRQRELLVAAAEAGALAVSPRLRFATVADRWLARFAARVAAGERRERTLEAHRYHVGKHLLPRLAPRLMHTISVDDVAALLTGLRTAGRSEKTAAEALATLHSIVRFAVRNGWIADNPVAKLEADERPHPTGRRQRVLGRDEISRLLAACLPRYRPLLATALYSGLRISELLGLVWDDVDLVAGVIHVRAQLSRAHRGAPARRVAPKTPAAIRDVPLVPQLAEMLREHRRRSPFDAGSDWMFGTGRGTPIGHRNVERRALQRAATRAGLDGGEWPPLRFHDLRHTFASHLILDLRLDPAQVSRILGHARVTITLDVYTHMFEEARHAAEIRAQMAQSAFAQLLRASAASGQKLVALPGVRTA
jgi:integrase